MANTISYVEAYLNILDGIYKQDACTSVLEAPASAFKTSEVSPQTIYVKSMTADGLGTYSRSAGYVAGDVTISWDAHTFANDRGRKYTLDAMDAEEAMTQAAEIAAEIYRTQLVPEVDAYRIGKIVSICGIDISANLTYDTAIAALDTAIKTLDDAEVPVAGRVLFVSNEMYSLMKQSGEFFNVRIAQTTNGALNRNFETFDGMPLIRVPVARFQSAFTFLDGTSQGETAGGFTTAQGAKALNFIIAYAPASLGIVKHMAPKMVAPELNQSSDGWLFGFRAYHDLFIMDNKKNGFYVHSKS